MQMIPIRVECYSGYKADEQPRAVHLAGERLEVDGIVDRWYQGGTAPGEPAAAYYKLRVGLRTLVVKHDRQQHAWFLMAESPRLGPRPTDCEH